MDMDLIRSLERSRNTYQKRSNSISAIRDKLPGIREELTDGTKELRNAGNDLENAITGVSAPLTIAEELRRLARVNGVDSADSSDTEASLGHAKRVSDQKANYYNARVIAEKNKG